ncbi:endoribonuclease Dicer-like isoform X2 [Cherax quadricarinatus]|uniref:endoribonuclease Dicer-like isoform X2 n=1 Tax=Cherax quadricarinatus TaxID=27406 RepID=UPI00387EA11E
MASELTGYSPPHQKNVVETCCKRRLGSEEDSSAEPDVKKVILESGVSFKTSLGDGVPGPTSETGVSSRTPLSNGTADPASKSGVSSRASMSDGVPGPAGSCTKTMAATHAGVSQIPDTAGEAEAPEGGFDFAARAYQLELFEEARKRNSILVLGTGSGKTFISILLIKELAEQIRGLLSEGNKRTVFVVNTVPLVHQQALAIETHTGLQVGRYEGSMGVDFWTPEKWFEELEKNEVLVMVAEIFKELVLHAKLPLSSVNLIIMDECHHTTGSHPMRQIMREYEKVKASFPVKCPRVLGLTACVIHRKCKKNEAIGLMKKLETAMDCALVTTTDHNEVVKYSTGPKEKVICYDSDEASEYRESIRARLQTIIEDAKCQQDIKKKSKTMVKKKMENIIHIMDSLGDWCVSRAIMYEIDHLDIMEQIEDVPTVRELIAMLREKLKEIYDFCTKEETIMGPLMHVSNKVKKLYEIFSVCKEEVYGLIFVERRNTAKILYDLLLEAAKESDDFAFVKPLYVVGSNSRLGFDIRLAQLELRKQKETLNKFRNGDCNFIVTTSVLEEGVDIRKCNVVIRFDRPLNYRSYVQSRGRARAHPSRYLIMVKESELKDLLETVEVYREIEGFLTQSCHDRQLPTSAEASTHFAEDEYIAPYEPYGVEGPKVTINSAIPLINVYCGKLPQDKFTLLTPEVVYKKSEGGCVAEIKLPINACFRDNVQGDCMENKDLAKKSAALCLCKKLHEIGELDHHLRPAEISDDSLLEGLVDVPPEAPIKAGEPQPGTKKRRQVYDKEVCQAFTHLDEGVYKLYFITIQPTGTQATDLLINSTKSDVSLGLICQGNLIHCPFTLYYPKWGEVEVKLEFIKEISGESPELMSRIEHFHKLIFETLLQINSVLFDFNAKGSGVYVVPMGQASTIDMDVLNQVCSLESLRAPIVCSSQAGSFSFQSSCYEDAIIYPLYETGKTVRMFYVKQILTNYTPQAEFPRSKKLCTSYFDYYTQKYDAKISNMQQPLLAAKHVPKELNYLKPPSSYKQKKKLNSDSVKLVPELCGILPLKASLWWQVMCIPSILHRLNSLNLAHQLNATISDSGLTSECLDHKIIFNWSEEVIARTRETQQNLCVSLVERKSDFMHPFALLHALTLRGANDNFDLERLEVLGDSFLKYITSEYLFLKETKNHEGRLTQRRGKLICNRTLFSLAKLKAVPQKIQSVNLEPPVNGFLPGFLMKPKVNEQLRRYDVAYDKWARVDNLDDLKQEAEEMEIDSEGKESKNNTGSCCYNPWSQHMLSDKSIADSVEALIGAYLLTGGTDAAINFLHKLGLGVCNGESLLKSQLDVPSAVVSQDAQQAESEIRRYYRISCLDRLEKAIKYSFNDKSFIVQAVTHSSYSPNKVTDCYQRLEFLGDAVLDYLVTGHIYSNYTSYSPGQISDLRSHYVKNETLAKVAAEMKLTKHLLHMAPKLSASIDKFLKLLEEPYEEDTLNTEEDEVDAEDVDIPKALGDLVESIVGAVYLDSGRSLQIQGLPVVCGKGKNYRTAKIAAAKLGLREYRAHLPKKNV